MCLNRFHDRANLKRQPPGAQLVKHNTQRVNITGGSSDLPQRLLWRHIRRRAHGCPYLRFHVASRQFSQTQVRDHRSVGQVGHWF